MNIDRDTTPFGLNWQVVLEPTSRPYIDSEFVIGERFVELNVNL